jgi:hypothetical protein
MIDIADDTASGNSPAPGLDTGSTLGKRYITSDPAHNLELLVTKGGAGTLSMAETPLLLQKARPLPSSD